MRPNHSSHPKKSKSRPGEIAAGVVGKGLMGTSIAACLLIAGHPVGAVEVDPSKRPECRKASPGSFEGCKKRGLAKNRARKADQKAQGF